MMGHRGCRLAVSYPEIAEMQTTAVINAAINVIKECGYNIVPHIMIPLVGEVKELKFVKDVVVATADKLIAEAGVDMKYEVDVYKRQGLSVARSSLSEYRMSVSRFCVIS